MQISHHHASKKLDPEFRWNFKVITFLTKIILFIWFVFGVLGAVSTGLNFSEQSTMKNEYNAKSTAMVMYEFALIIQGINSFGYFVLLFVGMLATMRSKVRFGLCVFVIGIFTVELISQIGNTILLNISLYWLSQLPFPNNKLQHLIQPSFFFSTSAIFSLILIIVHIIMWLILAYYAVQVYIRDELIQELLKNQ